jgi:hypothetical protein
VADISKIGHAPATRATLEFFALTSRIFSIPDLGHAGPSTSMHRGKLRPVNLGLVKKSGRIARRTAAASDIPIIGAYYPDKEMTTY